MSAAILIEHDVNDHPDCWSGAGSDRACPDRCQKGRRATRQPSSGINPATVIDLGQFNASTGLPDPCPPQRRSKPAAPGAITKSP